MRLIGCAAPLALLLVGMARLLGVAFPYVVGLLFVVVAAPFVAIRRKRRLLVDEFRARHGKSGKDLLLVYTSSPHWKSYIETTWLPRWGSRAVILNRSAPWTHTQVEARLWQNMAGSAEHTPVAIVVPSGGRPTIVRFWFAFRDFKHGKELKLRDGEQRLASLLERSARQQR